MTTDIYENNSLYYQFEILYCIMRYKRYYTQKEIAKLFGYSSLESFRHSSKHKVVMQALESVIQKVETNPLLKELEELITKYKQ